MSKSIFNWWCEPARTLLLSVLDQGVYPQKPLDDSECTRLYRISTEKTQTLQDVSYIWDPYLWHLLSWMC